MSSILLSYEDLQIPQALTLHHARLRNELSRAAGAPLHTGEAARHLAQLCFPHFEREEENIFRAFGLLHDLATDSSSPDMTAVARLIAQFGERDEQLREEHEAIKSAVEDLAREARREENSEIGGLMEHLVEHERTEDQVIYPAVLQIAQNVHEGTRFLGGARHHGSFLWAAP